MKEAQIGKRANIHYTVKLSDGKTVGASKGGQPLSFTIGRGKVFKALERGIIGMHIGDTRTIVIPPEEAYGLRDDAKVLMFERSKVDTNVDLQKGRVMQYRSETQEVVNMMVVDLNDDIVTLDANHPLAGETLTYTVQLVSLE